MNTPGVTMARDASERSFDGFLRDEGIFDEVVTAATLRVLAWQLQEHMRANAISKVEMARRMGTSRSQLDRLLAPENGNVTLDTIARAANALGRKIRLELV